MRNCLEFALDDLMAVTAIPVDKIPMSTETSPALRLTKTFSFDFARSTYFDDDTIVIGRSRAVRITGSGNRQTSTEVGMLIPIVRFSGKATDDEGDGVAGRLHTVKVTCEADDRDSAVWNDLLTLERTPSHLLLTFRDGVTQGFVSATKDSFLCEVSRDKAKTSVSIRIQNLMGIQLVRSIQ